MPRLLTDARPARNHVQQLVNRGMRQQDIAAAAEVSAASLSILLHGNYTFGRPAQEHIRVDRAERILAVEFVAGPVRVRTASLPWCERSAEYEKAGYRVGRCTSCGELAPLRTAGAQQVLVAHPMLDPQDGDDL